MCVSDNYYNTQLFLSQTFPLKLVPICTADVQRFLSYVRSKLDSQRSQSINYFHSTCSQLTVFVKHLHLVVS